jgi:hypothetical protein
MTLAGKSFPCMFVIIKISLGQLADCLPLATGLAMGFRPGFSGYFPKRTRLGEMSDTLA